MDDTLLAAADDLVRRLPPQGAAAHLSALTALMPEHSDVLRTLVDAPAEVRVCPGSAREYLCCAHNAHGSGRFRSPWTDRVHDAKGEETPARCAMRAPDAEVREIEALANEAFATYCAMYYDGVRHR